MSVSKITGASRETPSGSPISASDVQRGTTDPTRPDRQRRSSPDHTVLPPDLGATHIPEPGEVEFRVGEYQG
ncbi:hypothetical protein [Nocardia brasiliensis]|uniref:hypothetical protein n=1 Tax=Nocardia brasiliensis TaxID=37326 RepID=UPI0004A6B638|nr:hypothetical protein [Nocardia brasiliensis]